MACHAAGNDRESNNRESNGQGMARPRRNRMPRRNSRAALEKDNRRVKEMGGSQPRHEPGSRVIRRANRVIRRASEDRTERRRVSSRASNQAINRAASSRGRDKVNAAAVMETE